MYNAKASLYFITESYISLNCTDWFICTNGERQGENLSPTLKWFSEGNQRSLQMMIVISWKYSASCWKWKRFAACAKYSVDAVWKMKNKCERLTTFPKQGTCTRFEINEYMLESYLHINRNKKDYFPPNLLRNSENCSLLIRAIGSHSMKSTVSKLLILIGIW